MSSEILSTVSSFGNVTDSGENFTDEYFYDYDASFTIAAEELVPVALVYGITLILGIIGNSLVILSVTRYRRMNNITNTFLLGLATADLLLVLTCVPIKDETIKQSVGSCRASAFQKKVVDTSDIRSVYPGHSSSEQNSVSNKSSSLG